MSRPASGRERYGRRLTCARRKSWLSVRVSWGYRKRLRLLAPGSPSPDWIATLGGSKSYAPVEPVGRMSLADSSAAHHQRGLPTDHRSRRSRHRRRRGHLCAHATDNGERAGSFFHRGAASAIGTASSRVRLTIVASTVPPGTTREVVLPRLVGGEREIGRDVFLAFAPERLDPGNQRFTLASTARLVGGITPACQWLAEGFYQGVVDSIKPVDAPEDRRVGKGRGKQLSIPEHQLCE